MSIQLVVFDVDGTLLRGDTICQTIARGLGKYERMCEFEYEEVKGTSNIIAAREEMADWYLVAGRTKVESHLPGLNWAPGVEEGMRMLQQAGVTLALASVTWSFAVQVVANRFGIEHLVATDLEFDSGEINHVWGSTKADFLKKLAGKLDIPMSETAAVGDTSTDYDMLGAAGLGVFVGSGTPLLQSVLHMPEADIRDVSAAILNH